MLHINKSRANFIFVKKLFSGLGFLPLLCWIMMYSGGCDNNSPLPNPYQSGLYITGMQIDNKKVDVNSFAQVFNVSLRPNPLASISFSQPVSSIIDSIKKNLSIVHDKDKSLVAFSLRQSGNDSIVYIDLAAGAFLDRSKLYEITLKRGFYVQIVANTYSLIRSYSVKFTTVFKSNNTNLSVNYLGNDIVASDAGVFTIDTSFTTLPERIPLKLRVDPSSSVDEGNTKLSAIDGSIDYVFDVNSALNERRFIVTAEDGSRKEYTIVVKASASKYTVSFNTNGGSSIPRVETLRGGAVNRPPDPRRAGFTFNNWYSNSALTTLYDFSAAVMENLELYAKWDTVKSSTYTVAFNTNGGSSILSQTIDSGSAAIRPPSPRRAGYRFNNWYSDLALTTVYDFSVAVSSNLTLYAKWDTVRYTVSFNTNGGGSILPQTIDSGRAAVRPPDPTRAHFTFNNWYSNSAFTTPYNFSTPVTGDLTLYVKWDTVKYTVTFNPNNGSAGSLKIVHSGDTVPIPLSPMKKDSVFERWYSDANLTTVYDFGTTVMSNFSLYAKWVFRPLTAADTATITFNANSGSSTSPVKVRKGTAVGRPTDPTRAGYRFNNWYSDLALMTVYDFSSAVSSDLTLYAKWDTVKYTVTFNTNSGSAVSAQNVDSGGLAARPTNPMRTGYRFNAWYSDINLTLIYDFSSPVSADVTLYAKWDTVKYTVSFNTNGGGSISSQTIDSGRSAVRPPDPTRTHFTFNGWYDNSAFTTPYSFSAAVSSDLTLYAKWDTVKYTVTLNPNNGAAASFIIVNSGDTLSIPISPMKTDSIFDKWYSDANLTAIYDFSMVVTSNFSLYAKWVFRLLTAADTAMITFNANSGSSISPVKVRKGTAVARPSDPTRAGFTFNAWYSDANLTMAYNFSSAVTADLTLYAKWDTVKYTVTFNTNSGSAVSPQSVDSGSSAIRPTNPTRTHYTFNDWYSDAALTTAYDFGTMITSNATLYAKWDTIKYTVAFNTNSGSAVDTQRVNSGDTAVRPTNPTRASFTFNDWYIDAALTTAYDFGKTIMSNATLYAKWDTLKYTVTFNTNGGDLISPQRIDSGGVAVSPKDTIRAGYRFINWYSDAALTMAYNFSAAVRADLTLYAKWTRVYMIRFTVIDGTPVDPIRVDSGTIAREPAYPGYYNVEEISPSYTPGGKLYFGGWYLEENIRTPFSFSSPITSDTSLYARWTNLLGHVIYTGKILQGLPDSTDILVKNTLGNGNYPVGAQVIARYVKEGSTGDGTSWSKAAGSLYTLMESITNAAASRIYVVLVAASPNEYRAGANNSIKMKPYVAILGGFNAVNDTDMTINPTGVTTLSGSDGGPSRLYPVVVGSGGGSTTIAAERTSLLYGVTITGARNKDGGGIQLYNFSPTIRNVILTRNMAGAGAGIYINGYGASSPLIQNATFSDNSLDFSIAPTYTLRGAAVCVLQYSNPIFVNCSFVRNSIPGTSGAREGGAMYLTSSGDYNSIIFINCTFSENFISGDSRANTIFYDASPQSPYLILANSIFSNNPNNSSALYQKVYLYGGYLTMSNCFIRQGDVYAEGGAKASYLALVTSPNPSVGDLGSYGGPIPTVPISIGSSAENIGLYAKAARNSTLVYFSNDNISWFRYTANGIKTTATPPANAINLTEKDARGYGRVGKPDAGVYEANGVPLPWY